METRIALIPAYEPTDTLTALTRKLSKAGFTVIVIDDGSGSAYCRIFTEAGGCAHVLTHHANRGKGCALKTGLNYIKAHFPKDAVVVTMDADGQHSIKDAVRVCAAAEANPGCLFLGSRSFGGDVPARSRFGNTVTRKVYQFFTGVPVSDTQTGLRAFGADLVPFMLGVNGERYEYEMNVLLACAKEKIPIREVGIETIYLDNNAASHFCTVKDSLRVYREILKFAASSFTGFLVDYGMYSLLVILTGGLGTAVSVPLSNITARIVSASVNYMINKHYVFKNKEGGVKTAAQYFALAACILGGNTIFLSYLVSGLGVNRFAAKVVTEITFFTLSYMVQRFLIFRKKAAGPKPDGEKASENGKA
ncbi:MAG: GtrA family protein [Oscillospiraceae bacterium]